MQEYRRNIMVGLFVICGLAALASIVVIFGRGPAWLFGSSTYPVFVEFRSDTGAPQAATGVRDGTLVTVMGKEIGRVSKVEFVDAAHVERGVRVELAIRSAFTLPLGSTARTIEPGLGMGRPPIEIVPGPAEAAPLSSGAIIVGSMTTTLESIIPPSIVLQVETTARQLGEAAAAMTPVLEDVHEMIRARSVDEVDAPGGPSGNLATAAARLDATLKHMNDVLGNPDTQSNVRLALDNFRQLSEDGKAAASTIKLVAEDARGAVGSFQKFADQGRESLTKIDDHMDRITGAALDVLSPTAVAATELSLTLRAVNEGQGTLGKLMKDNKLYEALVLTAQRLAETIEEARILIMEWQKGKIKIAL